VRSECGQGWFGGPFTGEKTKLEARRCWERGEGGVVFRKADGPFCWGKEEKKVKRETERCARRKVRGREEPFQVFKTNTRISQERGEKGHTLSQLTARRGGGRGVAIPGVTPGHSSKKHPCTKLKRRCNRDKKGPSKKKGDKGPAACVYQEMGKQAVQVSLRGRGGGRGSAQDPRKKKKQAQGKPGEETQVSRRGEGPQGGLAPPGEIVQRTRESALWTKEELTMG